MTCNLAGWLHATGAGVCENVFGEKKQERETQRRQLAERAGERL